MPELSPSNELLRSAYEIANREGVQTNWEAFKANVLRQLFIDAGVVVGAMDPDLVARVSCTPKTYRVHDNPDDDKSSVTDCHSNLEGITYEALAAIVKNVEIICPDEFKHGGEMLGRLICLGWATYLREIRLGNNTRK